MKRIIETIIQIAKTALFLLFDNRTGYRITKEERTAGNADFRPLYTPLPIKLYQYSPEYLAAGFLRKLWFDMLFSGVFDHHGEMRFDELRKMWYYTDGKVKVYIKETYKETGPTFTECLLKAFLYEIDHLDNDQPKKES